MKRTLHTLEVDLLIEGKRHQMRLAGSGTRLVAKFPTLSSLFYFSRTLWPFRTRLPRWVSLRIQWRSLSIPWKTGG